MGVVRVAACTSVVLQFMAPDIRRCQALHPGIKIDLLELNSQGVAKRRVAHSPSMGIDRNLPSPASSVATASGIRPIPICATPSSPCWRPAPPVSQNANPA